MDIAIRFLYHLDDCFHQKNMKILLAPKLWSPDHEDENLPEQGWNLALSIKGQQPWFGFLYQKISQMKRHDHDC